MTTEYLSTKVKTCVCFCYVKEEKEHFLCILFGSQRISYQILINLRNIHHSLLSSSEEYNYQDSFHLVISNLKIKR